jgi:uncharacterized protein (DUF433 family)
MMPIRDVVQVNPEILGGQAVFKGIRVPVETIFNYLESGGSLELLLSEFPSLSLEQALSVLEIASKMVSHSNFIQLYEAAA